MTETNSECLFVYVELSIMIGDGDGYITGVTVLHRDVWEADMAKFENYLKEIDSDCADWVESEQGMYQVYPTDWTATPCTEFEADVLKKFVIGNGYRNHCKMPSSFIRR